MGRRLSTWIILLVMIFTTFSYDTAFAQSGGSFGCTASCHNSSGSGRSAVVYEEQTVRTSGGSRTGGGGGGGGGRSAAISSTNKNGGVIDMQANWKRVGTAGYQECLTGSLRVNSNTGAFVGVGSARSVPCEQSVPEDGDSWETWTRIQRYTKLCESFKVSMTSFGCETEFDLEAKVSFPAVPIHTRPYPATLVRYDSFVRIGDLPSNSGSNSISYIAWEGGTETEPARGDWRFVTLKITAYPKNPKTGWVYLEHKGWLELPVMELYKFQWSLPSHPEGGGGPLAGSVGQLQELPQDFPLLENYMRNAYGVVCELSWQEWEYIPSIEAEGWVAHTDRQEITPDMVPNLPEGYGADTNGDGKADAFWNMGVVVLRMNDANSIDDPVYAHSYSWGEVFYWAVREGQGQISFP